MVSTFILHFAPNGAMAPIVYRYKTQIFFLKINLRNRDYICFDFIDE